MHLLELQLMYPATNNHLIRSMLALFDCFVDDFGKEAQQQEETTGMDLQCQLEVRAPTSHLRKWATHIQVSDVVSPNLLSVLR